MYQDYDYGFKVIIAGSSGVGKSSLLLRFVDNTYQTNLLSTIGVDFKFKTLEINKTKIRLQIWDTAGSQAFKSIVSAYYRGADAIILVYNLTQRSTWNDLVQFWIHQVNKYKQDHCELMILGNMLDKESQSLITQEQIKTFMKKQGIMIYQKTSAKTGDQVKVAFEKLSERLIRSQKLNPKNKGKRDVLQTSMDSDQEKKKKKNCCK